MLSTNEHLHFYLYRFICWSVINNFYLIDIPIAISCPDIKLCNIITLTLIVPRAWEIGYTQPCIKCQGKSTTHFVMGSSPGDVSENPVT